MQMENIVSIIVSFKILLWIWCMWNSSWNISQIIRLNSNMLGGGNKSILFLLQDGCRHREVTHWCFDSTYWSFSVIYDHFISYTFLITIFFQAEVPPCTRGFIFIYLTFSPIETECLINKKHLFYLWKRFNKVQPSNFDPYLGNKKVVHQLWNDPQEWESLKLEW